MADELTVAPGEVHVWLCEPEAIRDPAVLATYAAWMTPDEAQRQARFMFERHRHQFLIARALVRSTLSHYADIAPDAWRFDVNPWGRPDIATHHGLGDLRFNLSHTDGLVAVAVARGELGVDVEDTHRRSHPEQVAEHFFAPAEVAGLQALPPGQRPARFFDLWTLKEAYIKARGQGLALSLQGFAFDLRGVTPLELPLASAAVGARDGWQYTEASAQAIGLQLTPAMADHAAGWQFVVAMPNPRHRLALAVRFATAAVARLHLRTVIPAGCLL